MRRRQFINIVLAYGAAAWPLAARAEPATIPIGYLHPGVANQNVHLMEIFRQRLVEAGYVEGRNLTIEYRWAEGQYGRLPDLATDLVRRQVALIVAPNTPAALAAKAATKTIPVVFSAADDPVDLGLVAGLARPGGNVTGVHYFNTDLGAKQLGLLREFRSSATRVGLLINPGNGNARAVMEEVKAAASTLNMEIEVVRATEPSEIDTAFAELLRSRVDALMLGADPFFFGRRQQLVTLAGRYGIPAIYNAREYAEAGGLMSYGTSLKEVYQQLALYTGRILKGEKPSDLPVVRSTRFELVINVKTAQTLGIDIPPTLLARADDVIE